MPVKVFRYRILPDKREAYLAIQARAIELYRNHGISVASYYQRTGQPLEWIEIHQFSDAGQFDQRLAEMHTTPEAQMLWSEFQAALDPRYPAVVEQFEELQSAPSAQQPGHAPAPSAPEPEQSPIAEQTPIATPPPPASEPEVMAEPEAASPIDLSPIDASPMDPSPSPDVIPLSDRAIPVDPLIDEEVSESDYELPPEQGVDYTEPPRPREESGE